ncbi:ribbon-helix-helix protein, CopG family [Streptomyces tailanensis]|nr:ribbon-helix-helix protein, CopG family [Streptomyces tailanensis]
MAKVRISISLERAQAERIRQHAERQGWMSRRIWCMPRHGRWPRVMP